MQRAVEKLAAKMMQGAKMMPGTTPLPKTMTIPGLLTTIETLVTTTTTTTTVPTTVAMLEGRLKLLKPRRVGRCGPQPCRSRGGHH